MEAYSLVADLLGRALLLHGLRLGGRAVLISTAYVDGVVTAEPAVPREHIGAEHTCAHGHRIESPSGRKQQRKRSGEEKIGEEADAHSR